MSVADILIVDDTPANLQLLWEILKAEGYRVRPVHCGEFALRSAKSSIPDLILLDITMPGLDGFDVCRILKEDPNLARVPVIFISALNETGDKVKAFTHGGVDYITKPFEKEEVLSRVKTHLSIFRYESKLKEQRDELNRTLEDLKATQAQLIESEKMASLGFLTAGVAHEINNPINFIGTSSRALKRISGELIELVERYDDIALNLPPDALAPVNQYKQQIDYSSLPDGVNELLENISSGVTRASEIVSSLNLFSFPGQVKKSSVMINTILDQAIRMQSHRFKKEMTLSKDYGKLPTITGCPNHLHQVFSNLLSNAIYSIEQQADGSPQAINIVTSVEESDDSLQSIVVRIEDSGTGINDEDLNHVFDPFFTTKDVGQGTGLGLSISYGIIKDHNGTLTAANLPSGGAVFTTTLPILGDDSND